MRLHVLFIASVCLLNGCISSQHDSLYQALGEKEGITTIVDNLLYYIAEDEKILHHFRGADIDRFRDNLIIHLCELSDGPCRFEGDSMAAIHAGMNISAAEFDSLVEDLMDAMDDADIAFRNQTNLVNRLVPFRDEIINASELVTPRRDLQ